MPVKRCGPLKLVKRKKEYNTNRTNENCYSSPTKKMKSVNRLNVILNSISIILISKNIYYLVHFS